MTYNDEGRGDRAGTPRRMTEPQDLPQQLPQTQQRLQMSSPPPPASFPSTCPDAIFQELESIYHASSGCNTQGKNLSSHLLGAFSNMPYQYQQMVNGKWHWPQSKAYLEGSVFHTVVLEGRRAYNDRYTSDLPINPTTGESFGPTTKKVTEWMESVKADGMIAITPSTANLVDKMAGSVEAHKEARNLLHNAPIREGVIRCKYNGLDCQIRMDAFGMLNGIVDLKSCANIHKFQYDAGNFHYPNQLAFYRQVLRIAVPDACDDVHIIATEKAGMLVTGVWKIPSVVLDEAQEENEHNMMQIKGCMQSGIWPTGYEDVRTLLA